MFNNLLQAVILNILKQYIYLFGHRQICRHCSLEMHYPKDSPPNTETPCSDLRANKTQSSVHYKINQIIFSFSCHFILVSHRILHHTRIHTQGSFTQPVHSTDMILRGGRKQENPEKTGYELLPVIAYIYRT